MRLVVQTAMPVPKKSASSVQIGQPSARAAAPQASACVPFKQNVEIVLDGPNDLAEIFKRRRYFSKRLAPPCQDAWQVGRGVFEGNLRCEKLDSACGIILQEGSNSPAQRGSHQNICIEDDHVSGWSFSSRAAPA